MHDSVLCLKIHQLLDDISFKSRTNGRFVAPLTIEKTTADDLDADDNHVLSVENSNGRSEFLVTIR